MSKSIFRLALIAVGVVIVTAGLSALLPIEAPAPNQESAALWLNTIAGAYLFGWINQILAMLAFSTIFVAAGLLIFPAAPLRAGAIWVTTLMATTVFLVTKFLSLWAVPMMAKAIAAESEVMDNAETFLTTSGPDVAFGLLPALDIMGFWLYALAALILFRPLFRMSMSVKIGAIALLAYGLAYPVLMASALIDILSESEFTVVSRSVGGLLFVAALALAFEFWRQQKSAPTDATEARTP